MIADTQFITDNFNTAFDAVGKVSLGGIALSADEARLFAMNLENRTLYALNSTTGAVEASTPVPLNPPGCAAAGDVRPFAVDTHLGVGYIGLVCSAESTPATPANLRGYVYSFNQTTLAISAAPVFELALNYPRGIANSGSNQSIGWTARQASSACPGARTDWEFPVSPAADAHQHRVRRGRQLILGVRDRYGDQMGVQAISNPTDPRPIYTGIGAGDTLRACGNPGSGWTFESNGLCGGGGTGPQNNNQGPGGGEFYWADRYPLGTNVPADGAPGATVHGEISAGGLVQVPGFPNVATTAMTPIPIDGGSDTTFDGGVRWFDNGAGGFGKGYRVFNGQLAQGNLFLKANGLGDLIALCDEAPIQIGNRVWFDANNNGRQDPSETPLANIAVGLYDNGGNQIATTNTSANGTYYFSSTGGGVLAPNTAYQVRIDTTQAALAVSSAHHRQLAGLGRRRQQQRHHRCARLGCQPGRQLRHDRLHHRPGRLQQSRSGLWLHHLRPADLRPGRQPTDDHGHRSGQLQHAVEQQRPAPSDHPWPVHGRVGRRRARWPTERPGHRRRHQPADRAR